MNPGHNKVRSRSLPSRKYRNTLFVYDYCIILSNWTVNANLFFLNISCFDCSRFKLKTSASRRWRSEHSLCAWTGTPAGRTPTSKGLQHISFTFVPFRWMIIESTAECHVLPLQVRDLSVLGPRMQHQVQVQCQQRARTAAEQVSGQSPVTANQHLHWCDHLRGVSCSHHMYMYIWCEQLYTTLHQHHTVT